MEPMKATSNQKAKPWTSPECSMWNLKGISILEGKAEPLQGGVKAPQHPWVPKGLGWWGLSQDPPSCHPPVQIAFLGF